MGSPVNGVKVKVKSLSRVRVFAILWTVAHQALPSMGFSRQEYWSGLPFPLQDTKWESIISCFGCSEVGPMHFLVLNWVPDRRGLRQQYFKLECLFVCLFVCVLLKYN